jgi:hypothetical protein
MLRNLLIIDEGRHKFMGRFLTELDYAVIVKISTFRVLRDKAGLTVGDEIPVGKLDAWIRKREKLERET